MSGNTNSNNVGITRVMQYSICIMDCTINSIRIYISKIRLVFRILIGNITFVI